MAHWKERLFPGIPIENVAFSRDNRLIATSSKHTVTLFQYKTSNDPIHVDCSSSVVSVCFNSSEELITVTADGEMTSWELQNDKVVKKASRRVTAFPVKNVVWSHSKKHSAWVTEAEHDSENDTLSVLMNDQTLEALDTVPRNLRKDQFAISGKFVAHCNGKTVTKILLERDEDGENKEVFTYNSILQGLTAEENEKNVFERVAVYGDTIAASLAFGKVYIWSNLGSKPFTLTSAYTLHWHKVSAPMVITPYDGLVSAGAETVLCKWALKGEKRPTLLSRLQAAVTDVVLSDDGSLVALLMEDNSLHVAVLSSMAISHSLPTITYSTRCPQSVFTGDSQVPGSVVMNGTPGWIQWFDLSSGGTREQACLSMENAVEGDVDNGRLDQAFYQLENVTLCPKSAATLESLVNFPQDYKRLRFWKRTSDLDAEIVNEASVPLDTQFISGCRDPLSSDHDELFIACEQSGVITVWKPNEDKTCWFKDAARSKSSWQKIPITAVSSISPKGVWASVHKSQENCHIVLWDVSEMTVLESFRTDGNLSSLEWATSSLLLISTSNSVTCWNLETLSAKWIVEQPLDCHVNSLGCFGWENNHVIRFDPSTGALLDSVKFSSNIESLVAVKYRNGVALVAKTEKGLAMLSSAEDDDSNRVQITKETPFSRLVAIPSSAAVTRTPKVRVASTQNVMKLLDAPCHALPPLSHLAPLFISSCLAPPCDA